VSDVASDALANCKRRQSNNATTNKKQKIYIKIDLNGN
jgi:hypothetical protein